VDLPDPKTTPTISVEEAGRVIGLSKDSAYKAAHAGQIPTLRFGKRMLVPTARLLELLGFQKAS
jgi:excisionase family DNA binding protein